MSIEALIFDVDGTLADTEEVHRTSFNAAFERHRLGWCWSRADYRQLLQVTGGKERITAYIATLPVSPAERLRLLALVPEVHADKTRLYGEVVNQGGVPLRDGVERLLNEALDHGCRLAIASTTSAPNVHALLSTTLGWRGLDMFSVIACGDQVRRKKPAPDIYQLALGTLGLPSDQALAVEDSPNGLRSARAAGLWTLVTPTFWTQDGDFSDAGLVLPGLGGPATPLPGEPGDVLSDGAWLSYDELVRIARPTTPLSHLQQLYRGVTP